MQHRALVLMPHNPMAEAELQPSCTGEDRFTVRWFHVHAPSSAFAVAGDDKQNRSGTPSPRHPPQNPPQIPRPCTPRACARSSSSAALAGSPRADMSPTRLPPLQNVGAVFVFDHHDLVLKITSNQAPVIHQPYLLLPLACSRREESQ